MAGSSVGSLRWVIGLPIFIVFTCCLILNAASQLLENSDPALAATLNPLNTDARINALVASLNAGASSLDDLSSEARRLVALSSADARGYSLVGAIEDRRGNDAAATASYAAALDHSRTERYALTRLLSRSLDAGDVTAAIRYFDLLLRRWREFSPEIAPLANDFITSSTGAAALKQALAADPVWRRVVVRELQASSNGVRFIADVLQSGPRGRFWQDDLVGTIGRLIHLGAPGEAYALFQQTLGPEESSLAGYVYDPAFTRPPGRRSFEWTAMNNSSVDARFPADARGRGLRLRFLDSPAKLGRPSQILYLPPGNYTLASTADGAALSLPKTLYWALTCPSPRREIARLPLLEGSYSDRTVSSLFTVPDDCPVQTLSLETGVTTSSWRDRYRGEILITGVSVSRVEDGA